MLFISTKLALLSKIAKKQTISKNISNFSFTNLISGTGELYGALIRKMLFNHTWGYRVKGVKFLDKNGIKVDNIFNKIAGLYEWTILILETIKKIKFIDNDTSNIKDNRNNLIAHITINKNGIYYAKDIKFEDKIIVFNKDLKLFEVSDYSIINFSTIELLIDRNEGFIKDDEHSLIGDFFPISSIYCPIVNVMFDTESKNIEGNKTDSISLTIETDGTINPEKCLARVLSILYTNFKILLKNLLPKEDDNMNKNSVMYVAPNDFDIDNLNLSTRLQNCLKKLNINNIIEFCSNTTKSQAKNIKDLGKKTFEELLTFMKENDLKFKDEKLEEEDNKE